MKIKITGILIFLFLQNVLTSQIDFSHNGTDYQIIEEQRGWEAATMDAIQRGGFLVQIDDQAEQDAIFNAIMNSGISTTYTTVSDGGGIAYIWIGATDKITEGSWLWDGNNDGQGVNFFIGQGAAGANDGEAIGYNNWGGKNTGTVNEPDDFSSNQDAGAIALAKWPNNPNFTLGIAGEWNDINILNDLYYIIEFPVDNGCSDQDLALNDNPIPSATYATTGSISSMGIIPSTGDVTFQSAVDIKLLPGFQVINEGIFSAKIESCQEAIFTPETEKLVKKNSKIIPISKDVNIFPNPIHNNAVIEFSVSHPSIVSLKLYSSAGILLKTFSHLYTFYKNLKVRELNLKLG